MFKDLQSIDQLILFWLLAKSLLLEVRHLRADNVGWAGPNQLHGTIDFAFVATVVKPMPHVVTPYG